MQNFTEAIGVICEVQISYDIQTYRDRVVLLRQIERVSSIHQTSGNPLRMAGSRMAEYLEYRLPRFDYACSLGLVRKLLQGVSPYLA